MADALSVWLALREEADAAARSAALVRAIADALPPARPIRVLDLATGTGANIRYLTDRLPVRQQWLAVDRSETLLAELHARLPAIVARGHEIETRWMDLGALAEHDIFAGRQLVTASALLDLVSPRWLRQLAVHCRAEGAAALLTITYDGRSSCSPAEPEDEMIRELMNRHQRTDKGLGGTAAGPDAASCAARAFADEGYQVRRAPSDWALDPGARDLQRLLIDGWARAAAEMAPDRTEAIDDWRARRLAHVDAGRSRVTVGHEDLAAWL